MLRSILALRLKVFQNGKEVYLCLSTLGYADSTFFFYELIDNKKTNTNSDQVFVFVLNILYHNLKKSSMLVMGFVCSIIQVLFVIFFYRI